MALPLGLLASTASAVAAWQLMPPMFSASSFLRVDGDSRPLIFTTADEAGGSGDNFLLYKNTHRQLMVTPFVLNAAMRDPQASKLPEIAQQADPRGWLRKSLKVSFPGDGEIMQVFLETETPDSCVKIVNSVVGAFMQEVVMNDRTDRMNRLSTLEKVFAERTEQVRSKQVALKNLASTLGTSDSDSLTVAQQNALQQYGRMQEKLGEVQFALMQAEGDLKIAEEFANRRKGSDEELISGEILKTNPEETLQVAERTADVVQLEESIAMAQAKLTAMTKNFGPNHYNVQKAREELDVKEQMLTQRKTEAKMRAKLMAGQDQRKRKTWDNSPDELAALISKTQVLANQEKVIQERVDVLSQETRTLGKSSIDVELMRSEIEGLEKVLQNVGDEISRTSVELKTSSRIRILSPAVDATPPDPMKRLNRALGLGLVGFLAPFGLIMMWDLSRKRVNSVESANETLATPLIGILPLLAQNPSMKKGPNSRLVAVETDVDMVEAMSGLASMILYSSQIEGRQVFMVSSAMPSEGKSTVSCLLAQSLAKAGKSVVLVDFDLRRPSIHRYLDLPLEPGLSESLHGKISFEETLQKSRVDNLSVISAGDWDGNLQERCSAGKVAELFNYLRSSFDLVVIDSSPVLPVNDARVVGKYTDGVVFTLVLDKSRLPASAKACEILRSFGITVLGTVIIGGNKAPGYYSGYYASYRQSGYGKKSKPIPAASEVIRR